MGEKHTSFQSFKRIFFPGHLLLIAFLLYLLSIIGIFDSIQDVRGDRWFGFLPFAAPSAFPIYISLSLIWAKDLDLTKFFRKLYFSIFVSGVPLIILNAMTYFIAAILPFNYQIVSSSSYHYWWEGAGFVFPILFTLIAYVIHLLSSLVILLVVVLPVLAYKNPELLTKGSNFEHVATSRKKKLIPLLFFSLALLITPFTMMLTLGIEIEMFLHPNIPFEIFKGIINNWTYGIFDGKELLWAIALVSMILFAILLIYVFLALNLKVQPSSVEQDPSAKWRNRLIKIGILFIIAIILVVTKQDLFKSENIVFENDIIYEKNISYEKEKSSLVDTLDFFEKIKLIDAELTQENQWFNVTKRQWASEEEPSYTFYIHNLQDHSKNIRYSMTVQSDDLLYTNKIENLTQKISRPGVSDVYMEEKDSFIIAYFEEDGLYYEVVAQLLKNETVSHEEFYQKIIDMKLDTNTKTAIRTELENRIEDTFIMPDYFTRRLPLIKTSIENNGLFFSYSDRLKQVESHTGREYNLAIEIETSNKPINALTDVKKRIVQLANGNEADLYLAFDQPIKSSSSYYQNVLFFEYDGVFIKIHSTNLERPLTDKEVPKLLTIANSMRKVE